MFNNKTIEKNNATVKNDRSVNKADDMMQKAKAIATEGDRENENGMSAEAIASYKKAIAMKPDYIKPLIQLGKIYEIEQNWSEAAKYYRRMTG